MHFFFIYYGNLTLSLHFLNQSLNIFNMPGPTDTQIKSSYCSSGAGTRQGWEVGCVCMCVCVQRNNWHAVYCQGGVGECGERRKGSRITSGRRWCPSFFSKREVCLVKNRGRDVSERGNSIHKIMEIHGTFSRTYTDRVKERRGSPIIHKSGERNLDQITKGLLSHNSLYTVNVQ